MFLRHISYCLSEERSTKKKATSALGKVPVEIPQTSEESNAERALLETLPH